jgi:hypothetical protein
VGEEAKAKDVEVEQGDAQVPDEVARREGLDQAAGTRVPPDALLVVHGLALLVGEHDPQGQGVDQQGLDERDDVGVPVGLLGAVVGRVELGEEAGREHGRDDDLDEGVEQGGADDLVDVQRQGGHGEPLGQGLDGLAQRRDGRNRERVAHGVGVLASVCMLWGMWSDRERELASSAMVLIINVKGRTWSSVDGVGQLAQAPGGSS